MPSIDGVPVVWRDLPGEVTAELVFGVGPRDEGVDRIGLSHLVQLLVLDAVGGDHEISLVDTRFVVSGEATEVAAHLARCCEVLADLPLERLPAVAARAEPPDYDLTVDGWRDPLAALLARRLGAAGAGAARWPAVPYAAFTAVEVREHAARFFHTGNAALALSVPPWPELRLPLPAGDPVDRPPVAARGVSGWYADEVAGPGIALSVTPGPLAMVLMGVLERRLMLGLDGASLRAFTNEWSTPVSSSTVELGFGVDFFSRPDPARAAAVLWNEVRSMAERAPSPTEIADAVGWFGADGVAGLSAAAKALLFQPSDEFDAGDAEAAQRLTPDEVRAAAASWLGSALVVVPTGTAVDLPGLRRVECPRGTVVPPGDERRPLPWRLPRHWRRRDERLILTDDAVHHLRDGSVHSVPFADAILIEGDDEVLLGNVAHGCLTDVTPFGAGIADRLPPRRHRR